MTKRDVERLWDRYDDDPIAALTEALAVVLDAPVAAHDEGGFAHLVARAPFGPERRSQLLRHDVAALDELARQLNEDRSLAGS